MLGKFRPRVSYANVIATLALFLALGGGALAASRGFTGSDGRIHGCVNSTGGLKVLKPPTTRCTTGKTNIAWNESGPRGSQGRQGIQGSLGDQGIQGIQGIQGNQGAPGEAATKLFAHVSAFGGVAYGSGAVSATHDGAAASGKYTVTFNRNLSGCVALATAGT